MKERARTLALVFSLIGWLFAVGGIAISVVLPMMPIHMLVLLIAVVSFALADLLRMVAGD